MRKKTSQSENGGDEFTREEVNERFANLMNRHPRMDPRVAEQEAKKALRWEADMRSADAGDSDDE